MQFWNAYAFKRDRIAAQRTWDRLSAKDRRAAFEGIGAYRDDCAARGISMMYAQGYLSHRRWEDEREETARPAQADNARQEAPADGLPGGYRRPTQDELARLDGLKTALAEKTPRKPYRFGEYKGFVVRNLCVPYVHEESGVMTLCLDDKGKMERITDYMIDYYDSYADFVGIVGRFFNTRLITLNIR